MEQPEEPETVRTLSILLLVIDFFRQEKRKRGRRRKGGETKRKERTSKVFPFVIHTNNANTHKFQQPSQWKR